MMNRVLAQHFALVRERLLNYAEHAGLAKHGDVKGLAREGIVREFLSENLPSLVEYKTGEILDRFDQRSGQLDIVLQSMVSPRIHLADDLQISLCDAVLGIIEVKSTLTTASWEKESHLKSALNTFGKVRSLSRERPMVGIKKTGDVIEHPRTPCFLLAYVGPKKDTLIRKMVEFGKHFSLEPDEYWPEVITILDRGYYVYKDNGWLFPPQKGGYGVFNGRPEECLAGVFVYLCQLIECWNGTQHHTPFASYFEPLASPCAVGRK